MYENETKSTSILDMARGAIMERTDYEVAHIVENILDENTDPKSKRKLTLTLTFTPDASRQNITVDCVAKATLVPTNPVRTSLFVSDEENIFEMTPQVPSQMAIDGTEEAAPPKLKVVKCG